MSVTYEPPKQALYTPVPGKLSYPVLVHATRKLFGRQEYEISSLRDPDATMYVTIGKHGARLVFEEDLTTENTRSTV